MFVVNLLLTLLLISLSPLFGVYAFVGYLDAVAIFSGPGQLYALVAAGSLNALAQSGGPAGALRQIEAASEAATLDAARASLDRADATARDSIAEARRAVSALASPRLDRADLPQALQALVASWSETAGCSAIFRCAGAPVPSGHDAGRRCRV